MLSPEICLTLIFQNIDIVEIVGVRKCWGKELRRITLQSDLINLNLIVTKLYQILPCYQKFKEPHNIYKGGIGLQSGALGIVRSSKATLRPYKDMAGYPQ